jgi:alanine racemase
MKGSSSIALCEESARNNVRFVKRKMGKNVRVSAVVKANAYGHGIEQMVPLFASEGIDHFSVFDYSEAIRVRNSLDDDIDIMIMGWIADEDLEGAVIQGFEFFVFSVNRLEKALEYAEKHKRKIKIHLEVETGMYRSGLQPEELEEVLKILPGKDHLIDLKGLCTHLAGPESISNYKRIISQLKRYNAIYKKMQEEELIPEYRHVACSAGAFVYPKARMDLVRIGIMLYGFWPSNESYILYMQNKKNKVDPLKRVLKWKSQIMAINHIKEGNFVGYGVSYLTPKDTTTAIIPVGYSMGYNRSLSNKGRVLINGHRCEVMGVINMNMIIANITDVPEANIGDEVVIIGNQGDLEIKVSAFTNFSEELNYEVLAHLPSNIKREVN